MHKRLINQCFIDLVITTEGPLLIKTGVPGIEGPDMSPVVTFRGGTRPQPYIPGSSLKGVLRSHAERIARTLCWDEDTWQVGSCNPFLTDRKKPDWTRQGSCGKKFEVLKKQVRDSQARGEPAEPLTTATIYRYSCPACKVFGSTSLLGRLSVPDAYLPEGGTYRPERRDGVGIDRLTGGSSPNAKFDLQVVTNAQFKAQLQLVNFELWQLGWLAYVLRDLSEGVIGIGSGKSRGLGQVSAQMHKTQLFSATHCLRQRDATRLWGLAALEGDAARRDYGYWQSPNESVTLEGARPIEDTLGLRVGYRLEGAAVTALWRQVAPIATQYFEPYEIPTAMRLDRHTAVADEE